MSEPVIPERREIKMLAGTIGTKLFDRLTAAETKVAELDAALMALTRSFLAQRETINEQAALIEQLTQVVTEYRRDHREDNWCHEGARCALCIQADAALSKQAQP